MEERREPQKKARKKTLIKELEHPTQLDELRLPEHQKTPGSGGATDSRQPYQPIPRTDEPTLQEMTNAPSRPLDKALVQDLVDWCGDIPTWAYKVFEHPP